MTAIKPVFNTDDARWQAVVLRDRTADGCVFYSVKSTGVFCRPSCASRRPNRKNVRFHASGHDAERAGYSACKRCRPNGASLVERYREAVTRACQSIVSAEETPTLAELAMSVGLSRFHFHRVFKTIVGVTPKAYAVAHRTARVRQELAKDATVTEAIYAAGFQSNGRFYATSTERLGMTPTAFRRGGDGTAIRFAVGDCSLGSVLVAASDAGMCAIFLGDDPNALARELQDRFPKADIVGGDATFDHWVAAAIGLVEQPGVDCRLPLDIRGTAFQILVWNALRQIPPGTTASYTEIAIQIGKPKAARAVAAACAANKIAIVIPCHRVVRTDETLSGYRWGVERKAELLKREHVMRYH